MLRRVVNQGLQYSDAEFDTPAHVLVGHLSEQVAELQVELSKLRQARTAQDAEMQRLRDLQPQGVADGAPNLNGDIGVLHSQLDQAAMQQSMLTEELRNCRQLAAALQDEIEHKSALAITLEEQLREAQRQRMDEVASLRAQQQQMLGKLFQREAEVEQLEQIRRTGSLRVSDIKDGAGRAGRWQQREGELLAQLEAQRAEAERMEASHAEALEAVQSQARRLTATLHAAINDSQAAADAAREHAAVGAAAAAAAVRHVGLLQSGQEVRAEAVIQRLSAQLCATSAELQEARGALQSAHQERGRLEARAEGYKAELVREKAAHDASVDAQEDKMQSLSNQARQLAWRLDDALAASAAASAAAEAHAHASQAAAAAAARHLTLSRDHPDGSSGLDVAVVVQQLSARLDAAVQGHREELIAAERKALAAMEGAQREEAERHSKAAEQLHREVHCLRGHLEQAISDAEAAAAAAQAHAVASAAAAELAARYAVPAHSSSSDKGGVTAVDVAAVLRNLSGRVDEKEEQLAQATSQLTATQEREAALSQEVRDLQAAAAAAAISSRAAAQEHSQHAADLQQHMQRLQLEVDRAVRASEEAAAAAAAHAAASLAAYEAAAKHFGEREGNAAAVDVSLLIHQLSAALDHARNGSEAARTADAARFEERVQSALDEIERKDAELQRLHRQVEETRDAAEAAARAADVAAEVGSRHGVERSLDERDTPVNVAAVLHGLSEKLVSAEQQAAQAASQLAAAERRGTALAAHVNHLQAAVAAAEANSRAAADEFGWKAAQVQKRTAQLQAQLDRAVQDAEAASASAAAHAAASLEAALASSKHLEQPEGDASTQPDVGAVIQQLSAALEKAHSELAEEQHKSAATSLDAASSATAAAALEQQLDEARRADATSQSEVRQLREDTLRLRAQVEAAVAAANEAATAAAAHAAACAAALAAAARHLPQHHPSTIGSGDAVDVAGVLRSLDAQLAAANEAQEQQAAALAELQEERAGLEQQLHLQREAEAGTEAARTQHAEQLASMQLEIAKLQRRLDAAIVESQAALAELSGHLAARDAALALAAEALGPRAEPGAGLDQAVNALVAQLKGARADEGAARDELAASQRQADQLGRQVAAQSERLRELQQAQQAAKPAPAHVDIAAEASSRKAATGSPAEVLGASEAEHAAFPMHQPGAPEQPRPPTAPPASPGEVQRLRQELRRREAEVQRLLGVVASLQGGGRGPALPTADAVPAVDTLRAKLDEEMRSRAEVVAAYTDLKAQLKGKTMEVDAAHRELKKAQTKAEVERIRAAAAAKETLAAAEAEGAAGIAKAAAAEAVAAALKKELRAAEAALQQAKLAAADTPAQYVALEVQRLAEENDALGAKLVGMESDLLESRRLLGHSNQQQKLQYYQRLKTQLEEMRQEANAALRDRFSLEQCVRYLAVKAGLPEATAQHLDATGTAVRAATDVLQPESLAKQIRDRGQAGVGGSAPPQGAFPRAADVGGVRPGTPSGSSGTASGEVCGGWEESTSPAAIEQRIRRQVAQVCSVKKPKERSV